MSTKLKIISAAVIVSIIIFTILINSQETNLATIDYPDSKEPEFKFQIIINPEGIFAKVTDCENDHISKKFLSNSANIDSSNARISPRSDNVQFAYGNYFITYDYESKDYSDLGDFRINNSIKKFESHKSSGNVRKN